MGDKAQVAITELHQHAKNVEKDADGIQNCANFGKQTDFGINTFGIIGQIFSFGARDQAHQISESLGKTAEFVRQVSKDLEDTAETYKQTDGGNAELFEKLEKGLEETKPAQPTTPNYQNYPM